VTRIDDRKAFWKLRADIIGQVAQDLISLGAADTKLAIQMFDSLQGPPLSRDEKPTSNKARKLFFELRILSRCLLAGLQAASCLHPDVKAIVDGRSVHIECKRVCAAGNLSNLVRSARNQLREQIKEHPFVVGVIAIDLTRLVAFKKPYFELAVSDAWPIEDASLKAELRKKYEPDIRKALERAGIQGVIFFYEVAIFSRASDSLGTAHSLEFAPLDAPGVSDHLLRKLYQAIAA
jgi:hypothetical protein